jgi:shikimate kinase
VNYSIATESFGIKYHLCSEEETMNVVLIGMSGAGKSTLGVLLAKARGMEFIDTDIVIRKMEGRSLQDIIDNDGIDYFLEIEEKAVADLQVENCVIATGGSVVYSEVAMKSLKQGGEIIYLHVPYAEIEKRLNNITTRGIVMKQGSSLKDVYDERISLYVKYSDKIIDCGNKDVEQCIVEILNVRS